MREAVSVSVLAVQHDRAWVLWPEILTAWIMDMDIDTYMHACMQAILA